MPTVTAYESVQFVLIGVPWCGNEYAEVPGRLPKRRPYECIYTVACCWQRGRCAVVWPLLRSRQHDIKRRSTGLDREGHTPDCVQSCRIDIHRQFWIGPTGRSLHHSSERTREREAGQT